MRQAAHQAVVDGDSVDVGHPGRGRQLPLGGERQGVGGVCKLECVGEVGVHTPDSNYGTILNLGFLTTDGTTLNFGFDTTSRCGSDQLICCTPVGRL